MIQPYYSNRTIWVLDWADMEVPAEVEGNIILPTCVLIISNTGKPVVAQEMMRELDQRRIVDLLSRCFSERDTPDEIIAPDCPGWDHRAWQNFGKDFNCQVRLINMESLEVPHLLELAQAAKKDLMMAFAKPQIELAQKLPPAELAIRLADTAQQIQSIAKKEHILRQAICIDENSSRALLELGDHLYTTGQIEPSLEFYQKAEKIEFQKFDSEPPLNGWENQTTRIYLCALFGQVLVHWQSGDFMRAVDLSSRIVTLNRKDNQGVRFLIPLLLLLAEQFEMVFDFFKIYEKEYPNDFVEPALLFAWGLALSLQDDDLGARHKYRIAMLHNLYIAPLLLDLPEPKLNIWHPNERSEPGYAYEFFDSFASLWEKDQSTLRVLREAYDSIQPVLDSLIRLRTEVMNFQDQRYEPNHENIWEIYRSKEKELIKPIMENPAHSEE